MATIEERLQALEQESAAHKQTEEMLTIAVRALVSKASFETLQETIEASQEQNGKLFNVLINQNTLHNERLTELDGKITGLQTEMRLRFTEQDSKTTGLNGKIAELDSKVTGLQTTQTEHTTLLQQILARLPEKP